MAADLIAIEPEPLAEAVIPLLENLLDKARAGELSSLAVAIVYRDGRSSAQWTRPPNINTMLGAVSRLSHKLNLAMDA